MHAVVHALKVGQAVENARTSVCEWICKPNFDIWIGRQYCKRLLVAFGRDVVQENAHPYSAICCLKQVLEKQSASDVRQDVVVLHVDGYVRLLNQYQAGSHSFDTICQRIKARLPRVRVNRGPSLLR